MDARRSRAAYIAAIIVVLCARVSLGGSYRTQNFIVTAPNAQLAREIGDKAESDRAKLAIEWLGREMPPWHEPCPITAQVAPNLGAGGATSFYFNEGHPFGWTMTIQGTRERVLDSVLPHEISHTIFATHFGRPLPRWADEGACTTVEHSSERNKQEKMLVDFLTTNRGIAFNKMFAMKDYPKDVMPLYSQGFSLTRFMIAMGGKQKFVKYVGEGMKTNNWPAATNRFYGFENLSQLQLVWVEWVRSGSREEEALAFSPLGTERHPSVARLIGTNAPVMNANATPPSPATTSLANNDIVTVPQTTTLASNDAPPRPATTSFASGSAVNNGGWYAKRRDEVNQPGRENVASNVSATNAPMMSNNNSSQPVTMSRPQPPEQAREVILEWSRPGPGPGSNPAQGTNGMAAPAPQPGTYFR